LRAPGVDVPVLGIAAILAGVAVFGLVWIAVATRLAIRGDLLEALRSE
jgi:hypothetical protein